MTNTRDDTSEDHTVSLAMIGGGGLEEMFGEELRKVLRNIADPNTEATKARVITVKVAIRPNGERRVGDVAYSVNSTTAATAGGNTTFYFGRRRGELVAVEQDPHQAELFDTKPDIRPANDERNAG